MCITKNSMEILAEEEEPDIIIEPVTGSDSRSQSLVRWLLAFLFHVQSVYNVSERAITCIICFLSAFLFILAKLHPALMQLAFPPSLYRAKRLLELNQRPFRTYVVCKKCHQVYHLNDCVQSSGSNRRSKRCCFVQFPRHPQRSMRAPCGELLLKTVEMASKNVYLYPVMTYCYLGLEYSIQQLLRRPVFLEKCQHWVSRHSIPNTMPDVYDGQVWKDFLDYDGEPFLRDHATLGLMMNMDFFQPFKHVNYSLGAIYLTVLNLPRAVRNKPENVILVWLIPGPHEPERHINIFLKPFVDDLLTFFEGVQLDIFSHPLKKRVRCALLCVACDLPAGRKVCGFLGTMAKRGCSRCLKGFPGCVGSMDYSGFDRGHWALRTNSGHREASLNLLSKRTKSDVQTSESASGCRYSILLKLPYFHAPRMLIIEPMHNLFLGSAKRVVKHIWISLGIVPIDKFKTVQKGRFNYYSF